MSRNSPLGEVDVAAIIEDSRALSGDDPRIMPSLITAGILSSAIGSLWGSPSWRDYSYLYAPQDYPFATTAAQVRNQTNMILTADSDFVWQRLTWVNGNTASGATDFRLNLIFGATQRQWHSAQDGDGVHAGAINGTGQRPYVLTKPVLMERASTTIIKCRALSADVTLFLDFHGYRIPDVRMASLTDAPRG